MGCIVTVNMMIYRQKGEMHVSRLTKAESKDNLSNARGVFDSPVCESLDLAALTSSFKVL